MASHDVFISYNRKDRSFVEFLVSVLEQAGIRCFQDVTGLKVFDKLDASLKSAIADSRWLMAVISPSYLQSYWCMFEAIEAIQGQDFERRFLPVVLRHTPDDQTLDEQFVLKALRDLDEQSREFEMQIVQTKAYELSAKLQKLNYVRANLPGVFIKIHERIFPEFPLWDDDGVRDTLRQVVGYLAPSSTLDVQALPLDYERLSAAPVVVPRLRELPSLVWKARVGCLAWKNAPLVVGNDVLVGSSGSHSGVPDAEDGIYCLDAETGTRKWFAPTPADANRVLVTRGIAVTGCKNGDVVAVSARDGRRLWSVTLDSAAVGGPFKLEANVGMGLASGRAEAPADPLLVVTRSGTMYLLDLSDGRQIQSLPLHREVLATPLPYKLGGYWHRIAVPTMDGDLCFVAYEDIYPRLASPMHVQLRYASEYAQDGEEIAALAAEPALSDGILVQGMVRNTSYSDPPLAALDAETREILWTASDAANVGAGFGNIRGAPVVVDEQVIFSTAYSRGLAAVSLRDGNTLWRVDLGQEMFEQWSGPVARGRSVYLGRHDGYLHKVDTRLRRREWSIYLGSADHAGIAFSARQEPPEFSGNAAWSAGGSAHILATPAIDAGRLYVGTHEGYLYCIGNLGDDDEG